MNKINLQNGDIVTLKSGSPEMTIECVRSIENKNETKVDCMWFNGTNIVREHISESALVKVGNRIKEKI